MAFDEGNDVKGKMLNMEKLKLKALRIFNNYMKFPNLKEIIDERNQVNTK